MPQQSRETRKRIMSKRPERSVSETVRKKREGGSGREGREGGGRRGNRQRERERRRNGMG